MNVLHLDGIVGRGKLKFGGRSLESFCKESLVVAKIEVVCQNDPGLTQGRLALCSAK